jgi:hypothetical protein
MHRSVTERRSPRSRKISRDAARDMISRVQVPSSLRPAEIREVRSDIVLIPVYISGRSGSQELNIY